MIILFGLLGLAVLFGMCYGVYRFGYRVGEAGRLASQGHPKKPNNVVRLKDYGL